MKSFQDLENIIKHLRHPDTGCPWDKKQTAKTLIPNFIEEVYEAVEAIEDNDYSDLCEELGDILLHVIFQVQLAEEKQEFTMDDVLTRIVDKLVRRHPHVFKENHEINFPLPPLNKGESAEEVKQNWEKIKLTEKKESRRSVLEGVPKNLPALIQAQRIQEKAAHVGFDWDSVTPVFDKINEEIEEVKAEIVKCSETLPPSASLEMEVGDLLFAIVNLSRKLNIDSESALRISNQKFKDRFQKLEKLCVEKGINMNEVGLEKLDELWEIIKKS
jgi:MazG family protein